MKLFVGALTLFFLLGGHTTQAALLYMDPGMATLSRGDAMKVSVRLDTDEEIKECVNAVEGVITFTGPITPVDISLGESIFSIWVEPPQVNENKQVTFMGGIPNGYCGRVEGDPRLTNNLFDIIVRADAGLPPDGLSVNATVDFTGQTVAYLNDGLGTVANLATTPASIDVLPNVGEEIQDPWSREIESDTTPPQPFSIQLERDPLAFAGKYYISFNTTDKQTGIDRYEVIEESLSQFNAFTWGGADAPWREVRSPYVLRDQSLNSTIRVRAIDKAGNQYVATIVPDDSVRTTSVGEMVGYTLLVLLFGAGVYGYVWFARLQRRKRQLALEAELEAIQSSYQSYDQ